MTLFQTNNFYIIKEAVDKKIIQFIYKYFLNKRKVAEYLYKHNKKIDPTLWGSWDDPQIPNTYSHHGDMAMDTLLQMCLPLMEKHTGKKLIPTYSYARLYKKGDVLARHKDRFSCEISTTLNLGGDLWSIFIEPNSEKGYESEMYGYTPGYTKGKKVNLEQGDMLIYKGNICEHWRNAFEGEICGQVFLHYNNKDTKGAEKNMYDGRPLLGLPKNYVMNNKNNS